MGDSVTLWNGPGIEVKLDEVTETAPFPSCERLSSPQSGLRQGPVSHCLLILPSESTSEDGPSRGQSLDNAYPFMTLRRILILIPARIQPLPSMYQLGDLYTFT